MQVEDEKLQISHNKPNFKGYLLLFLRALITIMASATRQLWRVMCSGFLFYLYLFYLVFLAYPINLVFKAHLSPISFFLTWGGLGLFVITYLLIISWVALNQSINGSKSRPHLAILGVLTILALTLSLVGGYVWLGLFIYVSVAASFTLPAWSASGLVGVIAVLMTVVGTLVGDDLAGIAQITLIELAVGIGMVGFGRLIAVNQELRAAREEIARLAVDEERLRFARDLHDLLGHNLSIVSLKSELAARLLTNSPEKASHEIQDIRVVTKTMLKEVREAVNGYRQPSLTSELYRARQILASVNIAYQCEGELDPALPAFLEGVLAWTVREGVTNVVKHSRAQHCHIHLKKTKGTVSVEITDDGSCGAVAGSSTINMFDNIGSGLAGLAERASRYNGTFEAGLSSKGGFRLCLTLPISDKLIEKHPLK